MDPLSESTSPTIRRRASPGNRALDRTTAGVVFALVCALLDANGVRANPDEQQPKEPVQSLDEQVQEMKSDVLGIAAELRSLEEKLLFPSNTQVSIFVSLPAGQPFRLDSMKLRIDGKPVANHIYSLKELEALDRGGVQRIYTGNVAAGAHELDVEVAGKSPGGGPFEKVEHLRFEKAVEPRFVELSLVERESGAVEIELEGS